MQKKWERSNKHTFFFYTRVQLRTFCVCSCVVQLPLCYLKDMGKRGMKKITQQVASNSLFWDGDGGRGGVTSGEEKSSKEFFLGTIAVGDDSLLKNKMESLLILLIYVGDSAEIVSPPLAVLPPDHILCGHPTTNGGMPNGSSVEIRMYVHIAYTFLAHSAPICMHSRCLLTKFLHRSSVRSLLKVRCWLGKQHQTCHIGIPFGKVTV